MINRLDGGQPSRLTPNVLTSKRYGEAQLARSLRVQSPDMFQNPSLQAAGLRFGEGSLSPYAGTKGLWITPEFYHSSFPSEFKKGGVGQVSSVIPWQMRARGVDIRPIFPLYMGMEKLGFEKAELDPIHIKDPSGNVETYELYWKDIEGVVSYAIKNRHFSEYKSLYQDKVGKPGDPKEVAQLKPLMKLVSDGSGGTRWADVTQTNQAPVNVDVFRFNKAVAAFAPKLDQLDKNKPTQNWQFKGGADVNFYNDWFSGVVLSELKEKSPEYLKRTGSVFYVHNTYDYDGKHQQLHTAEKLGVEIPKDIREQYKKEQERHWLSFFQDWLGKPANGITLDKEQYAFSPLGWGMRYADTVIMNHFYKETNLKSGYNTDPYRDPMFLPFLKQKEALGRVHDMHHAVAKDYNPYNNPYLTSEGFTQLQKDVQPSWKAVSKNQAKQVWNTVMFFLPKAWKFNTLSPEGLEKQAKIEEFKRYKQTNKTALQQQLNLKQDPKATMYLWLARPDIIQKGTLQVTQTLTKFLYEHPHAQVVLGGAFNEKDKDPKIAGFAAACKKDPNLQARIHFSPGFFDQKMSHRTLAAADIMMHPSTYEPYGLSQLEAMTFGTVPIVGPRDGLYATVHDPHVLPTYHPHPADRNRTAYGQTGFHVDLPDDGIPYLLDIKLNPSHLPTNKVVKEQNKAFLHAMERAESAIQTGEICNIAQNGINYVAQEHTLETIGPLYDPVIGNALKIRDDRMSNATKITIH